MKPKIRPIDRIFNFLIVIITFIFALICIYPIYYVFIYSISDPLLAQSGVTFLPRGLSLESYRSVFTLDTLSNAFLISVLRTVIGTFVTVLMCSLFGYLMTQEDLPFRGGIYRMMVITMYIGGGLIPTYLLMKNLKLMDTFLIYIIPGALSAYNVILVKTYMESIPKSLEESAQLDGASYLRIFFSIILPVSIPILATVAIFSAVGQWSSWFDNMLYINDRKLYTIQYILYQYLNEAEALANQLKEAGSNINALNRRTITPESIKMAITMVVIVPILFVYPFMQNYFIKGIMIGAVKG